MHILLGLIALIFVCIAAKRHVPILLSGSALLFIFFETSAPYSREFFSAALTEWSAICHLFFFYASVLFFFQKQTGLRLFFLFLSASFAILTRPAFIVLIPIIFIIYLFCAQKQKKFLFGILGLTPLIFWMSINSYVLGSFSLTTFGGVNIFGVACLIGHAESKPSDSQELYNFITKVNAGKKPEKGGEKKFLKNEYRSMPTSKTYNYNIYQLVKGDDLFKNYHPAKLNQLMKTYAIRTILAHPLNYLQYVTLSLIRGKYHTYMLLVGFLLTFLCFRFNLPAYGWGVGVMTSIHFLNVILCCTIQMIIARYVLVTYGPMVAAIIISLGALCFTKTHSPFFSHSE